MASLSKTLPRKRAYHKRKAEGLCVDCCEPAEPNRARCKACLIRTQANKLKVQVKVETETHISCPKCGTGDIDSQFQLFCVGCMQEFKAGDKIICANEYQCGNPKTHYHVKCYIEFKNQMEGV